jgi:hypothetical protein
MTLSDRNPYAVHAELNRRVANLERDALECPERLNGPHCPHEQTDNLRSTEMICCWCGLSWSVPHAAAFDRHGTYAPRTREGGS